MTVSSSGCSLPLQQELDEIKGEMSLAFTQFSDFMQNKNLADIVTSSLSFSKNDLEDGHNFNVFKCQIDYIRNYLQIVKLFPNEMSMEISGRTLRGSEILLRGVFNEMVQTNKPDTDRDNNDEKDISTQQQVLSFFIQPIMQLIDDCLETCLKAMEKVENGKELEEQFKYSIRIFVESSTFLVSSTGLSLQKPDFLRIMGLCQKVWKFSQHLNSSKICASSATERHACLKSEMETVEEILKQGMPVLLATENGKSFVKFWVETLYTGKECKISQSLQEVPRSGNFPELYMIFTCYLEDAWFWKTEIGKAITPNLIEAILQDLACDRAEIRKRAAFVLRAITVQYSQSKPVFDHTIPKVQLVSLNNMQRQQYSKFWDSYFDIHDILNETQLHIVQPVLQKFQIFKDHSSNDAVLVWLPILLKKMIGHDNRTVVKIGFEQFLQTGKYLQDRENSPYRPLADEFLATNVMPLIRDNIGWVLNEPEQFFNNIVTFGRFLMQLYSNIQLPEFKSAEVILDFLISSGKCMGPHTIYFLISALDKVIFDNVELEFDGMDWNVRTGDVPLEKVASNLELLMNQLSLLLSNNLTTVSKYFRGLLEHCCLSILGKIMPFFRAMPDIQVDSFLFMKLLTFMGSLSAKIFCDDKVQEGVEDIVYTFNKKWKLIRELTTGFKMYEFAKGNLSAVSRIGLLRYILTSLRVDDGQNRDEIQLAVKNYALLNKDKDLLAGSIQGLCEFYQQTMGPNIHVEILAEVCEMLCDDNDQCSLENFMFCVRRLEILSVIPKELLYNTNYCNLPQLRARCPLKTFLIKKLYLVTGSKYASLDDLKDCSSTDFAVSNIKNIEEISSWYFGITERNLLSEFYQVQFSVNANIISNVKQSSINNKVLYDLLTFILDAVEKCNSRGVATGLHLAKLITRLVDFKLEWEGFHLLDEIAAVGWSLVFEFRKSEAFWFGIRAFVDLICCPYFLKTGVLHKYADLIFEHGETVNGLPLVLVSQLVETKFPEDLLGELHTILLKAALAGGPLAKNNRVTFAIWDYVTNDNLEDNDPENFSSDCKARLMACEKLRCNIECMVLKEEAKDMGIQLLEDCVTSLLERNDLESISRKRYFQGSLTHRIKQRIGQLLLILQPYFDFELSKKVLDSVLQSLSTDSPQPSVRYMAEWLVVLIVQRYPELVTLFFDRLDNCIQKRLGFGAFFATICLQVSKLMTCQTFYDRALQSLATLTLSQHLTVRIYAQIAFQRIYERIQQVKLKVLVDKYAPVLDALEKASVYVSGNCSKLLENVSQDFYVNVFDSVTHYCHEVIFALLPRLSGMIKDECILKPEGIRKIVQQPLVINTSENLSIPPEIINIIALQKIYADHEKSAWHLKTVVADGRELGEEIPVDNICSSSKAPQNTQNNEMNYQKKINPWKLLSASDEIEEYTNVSSKKKCVQEEGLIVVASLLDHLPNLGGLCRTCEIFGVHKYVLNSLKVVNDQHFQSLSVSAQNWVNILEVPVRDLKSFLLTYSTKGYTILGVEQANESTSLIDFNFPKKSVLLLGNEKLGIPSELLHLVDKCIEIPQVGIIRSLNVHVTGALCIWQYASQNTL